MTAEASPHRQAAAGDVGLYTSVPANRYFEFVGLLTIVIGGGLCVIWLIYIGLVLLAVPFSLLVPVPLMMAVEMTFNARAVVLHTDLQQIEVTPLFGGHRLIDLHDVHSIRLRRSRSRLNQTIEIAGDQRLFTTVVRSSKDLFKWANAVAEEAERAGFTITVDVKQATRTGYPSDYPGTYTFVDARAE